MGGVGKISPKAARAAPPRAEYTVRSRPNELVCLSSEVQFSVYLRVCVWCVFSYPIIFGDSPSYQGSLCREYRGYLVYCSVQLPRTIL